jgi:hypothetical protein
MGFSLVYVLKQYLVQTVAYIWMKTRLGCLGLLLFDLLVCDASDTFLGRKTYFRIL